MLLKAVTSKILTNMGKRTLSFDSVLFKITCAQSFQICLMPIHFEKPSVNLTFGKQLLIFQSQKHHPWLGPLPDGNEGKHWDGQEEQEVQREREAVQQVLHHKHGCCHWVRNVVLNTSLTN